MLLPRRRTTTSSWSRLAEACEADGGVCVGNDSLTVSEPT